MIASVPTPQLLNDIETCPRKGFFSRSWASHKLPSKEMTIHALRTAMTATEPLDGAFGEVAGAEVMQLAADRGLETDQSDIYSSVIHHAALSDVLVSAIRKPTDEPWLMPDIIGNWISSALMSPDGKHLRRIALVSHWNDARHYAECRSWWTMGEIAHYKLPMQLIVLVIGQERAGKRSSPWTTGFLHPQNHVLRFRKKSRSTSEVFNDKWEKVYREDHAEISRETWLNSMLKDDVLSEVCFKLDIPVPPETHCQRIRDIASRKLERLEKTTEKPEANLSSCDWPTACAFRKLCHTIPEREPSLKNGYVQIRASCAP